MSIHKTPRWVRFPIAGLIFISTFWFALSYVAADFAMSPKYRPLTERTEIADVPVQPATFTTEDNVRISAWHIPVNTDRAVILLAGIHNNRNACKGNAEVYLKRGYSVLMPDLRGTGLSGGDLVSIGWHERKDLMACYKYLRDLGYRVIGAHGMSLGAATICYASKDLPDLSFAVLESSYDTIESALYNRMDLRGIPHAMAFPMTLFATLQIGATLDDLRPDQWIANCKFPTLIMCGDDEGFLKVSETESLFKNCGAEKKEMYVFKGGKHKAFVRQFSDEFTARLFSFLGDVAA
jgi:alpha-beta hydrolase superfamily lysophospholipase